MKKNRTVLFVLFWVIFISLSFAQEEKKYPPYPEVWGYELTTDVPSPFFKEAKMENGDYMIIFIKKRVGEKINTFRYKRTKLLFFAGISRDLKDGEYDEILDRIIKEKREVKLSLIPNVIFSDGSILEVNSMGGSRCADPFDIFLRKRDKDGKAIAEKMLLNLYDKPIRKEINHTCERNWEYKGKYYFEKIDNMLVKFIPLTDDTLLVLASGPKSVVIIRFDKDFNTKNDLMNRKIFLVDRKAFEEIRNKLVEKNDQAVNDALSNYLTFLTRREGDK